MRYTFYPLKNDPCPNVGHCPHAGGASIASLVLQANDNEMFHRYLHGTIDAQRERNRLLFIENENLNVELEQVKLQLKLERQYQFATHKQCQSPTATAVDTSPIQPPKKSWRTSWAHRLVSSHAN